MATNQQHRNGCMAIRDAVTTMDPFAQKLVGLAVGLELDARRKPVRTGMIISHECYDTDCALCVERVTVRWDDGSTARHSLRYWLGDATGDGKTAAWLVALHDPSDRPPSEKETNANDH